QDLTQDPSPPLVLRITNQRLINVNASEVTFDELPGRLRRMFAARDDHVLFFDAEDDVDYGFAVAVMDQARAGGAVTIAPLIAKLDPQADAPPPAANDAPPPAANGAARRGPRGSTHDAPPHCRGSHPVRRVVPRTGPRQEHGVERSGASDGAD